MDITISRQIKDIEYETKTKKIRRSVNMLF